MRDYTHSYVKDAKEEDMTSYFLTLSIKAVTRSVPAAIEASRS
jgi:hypothetical protein